MGRQIKLEGHLDIAELEKGYRAAVDGRERSHWQMIWLLAQGKRTAEVAQLTGYSVLWVREVVHRYNAQGEQGLRDTRHTNLGREPLLTPEQESLLKIAVEKAEAEGTPWTGVQVAAWMSQTLARPIWPVRGWEVLQRWGFKRKVTRQQHTRPNSEMLAAFKKT